MLPHLAFVAATRLQQLPTGRQILVRAQAAYDSVKTLTEDVTASMSTGTASAHIVFKRPGLLHVSGRSMFGSPYQLLCDGHGIQLFCNGSWQTPQSPEMGIATLTGLAATAPTNVPAALLHTKWGSFATFGTPGGVSRVTLNGQPALRVEFSSQLVKRTVWFNAKTYFLAKMVTSISIRSKTMNMDSVTTLTFGKPVVNRPIPNSAFKKS